MNQKELETMANIWNVLPDCRKVIKFIYDNFEEYEVRKMFFNYIMSANTGANTTLGEILKGFAHNISEEGILSYSTAMLTPEQMEQVRLGIETSLNNLGVEVRLDGYQIATYANGRFDVSQMAEIRTGYELDIPNEIVELYASPEFTAKQMAEIKTGYENGLSMEQIASYAKPEYDAMTMTLKRRELEKEKK